MPRAPTAPKNKEKVFIRIKYETHMTKTLGYYLANGTAVGKCFSIPAEQRPETGTGSSGIYQVSAISPLDFLTVFDIGDPAREVRFFDSRQCENDRRITFPGTLFASMRFRPKVTKYLDVIV